MNGRNWPLCKALHNGHYGKCRFIFSALAASEIWPGFDAFHSLASFA
jgi:hypothetical protein